MANRGSSFFALLTGAAIGAGFGLLYAPDRGDETRRKISDNARKAQDNLNRQYRETSSNLSEKARKARTEFEEKLEDTLSTASFRADEILGSLEERLEELRKQNAKFQKKDKRGDGNDKDEQVETRSSDDVIKPSTDNAIV